MKQTLLAFTSSHPVIMLSLMVSLSLLMSSCATKYTFLKSSVVPSAEGTVKVTQDRNSNYEIDMSVVRLVDPERLTPSMNYYVTWMKTENGSPKNIGQLKTSSGMFSKAMKSSLTTVSSFYPTGFFITAENDANVQYPSQDIILRTGDKD